MIIDWTHVNLSGNLETLETYVRQTFYIDNKSYIRRETQTPTHIYNNGVYTPTIYTELYNISYGDSTIRTKGQGLSPQIATENGALVALRAIEFADGVLRAELQRDNKNNSWEDILSLLANVDNVEPMTQCESANESSVQQSYELVSQSVPVIATSAINEIDSRSTLEAVNLIAK